MGRSISVQVSLAGDNPQNCYVQLNVDGVRRSNQFDQTPIRNVGIIHANLDHWFNEGETMYIRSYGNDNIKYEQLTMTLKLQS